VPRYYFTRNVVPVSDAAQAVSKLFERNRLNDVTERSFVENFSAAAAYSRLGGIVATGSGDHVKLAVEPAAVDRFLVANELYYPGWTATVDGKPTPIYPTNAVMRGVVVPAGVSTVEVTYTPFTRRNLSFAFYGAALLLTGVGTFVFSRSSLWG
jgi:Bacterial membrane protein YfhO